MTLRSFCVLYMIALVMCDSVYITTPKNVKKYRDASQTVSSTASYAGPSKCQDQATAKVQYENLRDSIDEWKQVSLNIKYIPYK